MIPSTVKSCNDFASNIKQNKAFMSDLYGGD